MPLLTPHLQAINPDALLSHLFGKERECAAASEPGTHPGWTFLEVRAQERHKPRPSSLQALTGWHFSREATPFPRESEGTGTLPPAHWQPGFSGKQGTTMCVFRAGWQEGQVGLQGQLCCARGSRESMRPWQRWGMGEGKSEL
jgi:hypothetical protein